MALLEIRVFRVLRLLAAIALWILATISQVIEPTKEPAQFRILSLTLDRDGGVMQPITDLPDLFVDHAWRADHRGRIQHRGAPSDLLQGGCARARMIPEVLHPVPVGIVPGGHRLADARRAVAEADVAIARACLAEFCESTMFKGVDE